jgi:hypothetical protein
MTSTAPVATRHTPHLGTGCPPWCATDHDTPQFSDGTGFRSHLGARAVIQAAGPRLARIAAYPSGNAAGLAVNVHVIAYDEPEVADGYVIPGDPEALALLVELLADATPDQHRELAAAIRKAAADITDDAYVREHGGDDLDTGHLRDPEGDEAAHG